jgi:hypothetical protein
MFADLLGTFYFCLGRYLAKHGKTIAENLTKTSGVLAEGLSVRIDDYILVLYLFSFILVEIL